MLQDGANPVDQRLVDEFTAQTLNFELLLAAHELTLHFAVVEPPEPCNWLAALPVDIVWEVVRRCEQPDAASKITRLQYVTSVASCSKSLRALVITNHPDFSEAELRKRKLELWSRRHSLLSYVQTLPESVKTPLPRRPDDDDYDDWEDDRYIYSCVYYDAVPPRRHLERPCLRGSSYRYIYDKELGALARDCFCGKPTLSAILLRDWAKHCCRALSDSQASPAHGLLQRLLHVQQFQDRCELDDRYDDDGCFYLFDGEKLTFWTDDDEDRWLQDEEDDYYRELDEYDEYEGYESDETQW